MTQEAMNARIAGVVEGFEEVARTVMPLMVELGRAFSGTILPALEVAAQVRREQRAVRGRAYVRRLRARRSGRR